MTDNDNVVDFPVREDGDWSHRAAMSFLLSRGSQPVGYNLTPTEMMRFAEELMSLSLAILIKREPDSFERTVMLTLEVIEMRASHLRAKFIAGNLIPPPKEVK